MRLGYTAMLRYALTCIIVLHGAWTQAQNTVDFTIPAEVCIGEVVSIVNNTPSGTDPRWSFCSITDGPHAGEANGSIAPSMSGLSLVEENGDWFGLAVTRDGLLFRVAFGSDPSNGGYTVTPLGNPGNLLTGSEWIHVIKEADKWYGLVTNVDNDLVRLTWTSLLDNPQAQKLGLSSSGKLDEPTQVEIQKDGSDYVAIVANTGSNTVALVNFGNSMSNNPQSSDVISSPALSGPLNMYGVSSYLMCGSWTIHTAVTDKLYRIDIGAHLFSAIDPAQITDVSGDLPVSIGSYTRLKSIVDGVDAYLYLTSYTTNLFARVTVTGGASPLEFEDLSSTTQLGQLYTLEVYNYKNSLGIYVGSFGSGAVTHVGIETNCSASFPTSNEMLPKGLFYTQAGTYKISLTMTQSPGVVCSQVQEIVVKPQTSPDIRFETTNVCINHDVIFDPATSSNDITMYQWNFGDGNLSTDVEPVHQFTTADTFTTRLLVTASNGCTNSAERELKIYNVPGADFQLPTGLICTNNEFTFENTTAGDFDGHIHFDWSVQGEPAGVERDLTYTFSEPGDYEITLNASIPGCENIITLDLTGVMAGPAASFTISGAC
jgi:PKD repeat protein